MTLETAEEFAVGIISGVWDGMREDYSPTKQYAVAAEKVEARDAAMKRAGALEVLDAIDRVPLTGVIPYPLRDRLQELRAKYAKEPG